MRHAWIMAAYVLTVGAGQAADWTDQISRTVELPAHRWLAEQRAAEGELTAFTTDGCSGGMSSLWTFISERYPAFSEAHGRTPPWESCCVTHDRAYHSAGPDPDPDASYDARLAADETLRQCVRSTASDRDSILIETYGLSDTQVRTAYQAISDSMFQAVRLGGGPCTGLPWRWGYGHPQCWQRITD